MSYARSGMGILDRLFGSSREVAPTPIRDLDTFRTVVLESEIPVVLDVWSATCAPCRKLVPVLVEIATRYEGRVRVAEVSLDSELALLETLAVQATPTIIVYDRGEELGRMAGYRPASWFDEMIATEFPDAART
jgi:thioredoxin-like negative regulator of GroEL